MKRVSLYTTFYAGLVAVTAALATFASADEPMHAPNFRLPDAAGQAHELYAHSNAKAVVLFVQMNGCPIVRQSYPYMEEIRAKYEPQGVVFLYINSNPWDTDESIVTECTEYAATVPVLRDRHRALAHALGFKRSAETFVLDPKSWRVLYRGMADDRFDYGLQRMSPSKFWLKDTLEAVVTGASPSAAPTVAKGCLLDLDFYSKLDFTKDIAPILTKAFPARFGSTPKEESARIESPLILGALLTGRSAGREIVFGKEEGDALAAWLFTSSATGNPAP